MNSVSEHTTAEPLATVEAIDLAPMQSLLGDLIARHSDAEQKLAEYLDAELEAQRSHRLAQDAVVYQKRHVDGLTKRVVTIRDAIRAAEDHMIGIEAGGKE